MNFRNFLFTYIYQIICNILQVKSQRLMLRKYSSIVTLSSKLDNGIMLASLQPTSVKASLAQIGAGCYRLYKAYA